MSQALLGPKMIRHKKKKLIFINIDRCQEALYSYSNI